MAERRLTLDNPVFKGTLRAGSRSVLSYDDFAWPRAPRAMHDVKAVRQPRPVAQTPSRLANLVAAPKGMSSVRPQAIPMPKAGALQRRQTALNESLPPVTVSTSEPTQPEPPHAALVPTVKPSVHTARRSRRKMSLKEMSQRFKKAFAGPKALYAAATVLVLMGIAVNLHGFWANAKVQSQVKTLRTEAHVQGASTVAAVSSSTPPTTEKPSVTAVRAYTVAPNLPKYIDIKTLGVHARVLSMSVDANNELQAPYSIWDAGWYNASSQPGQAGATLIDGHSGIGVTHGIFHDLAKLKAGDVVTITKGDNTVVTYKVVDVKTVAVGDVDMSSMMVSADATKSGLNIITCTGRQIAGTTSLDKRVLVHAVQV